MFYDFWFYFKDFDANQDRDTIVYHQLSPAINALSIRLRPIAWFRHISMRMELYGCEGNCMIIKYTQTLFMTSN